MHKRKLRWSVEATWACCKTANEAWSRFVSTL